MIKQMVLVKDNFFKEDLLKLIVKSTEAYKWSYYHKSDMDDPTYNKFFVSYLWDPSSEDNFSHMLWRLIHRDVPCLANHYCWRIIANGQVKGQNGNWHTDHGDMTVLYFPLEWIPEWGGSTYLKIDETETSVQYKQNRLVVFNSKVLHYGSSPAVDNILRVSIAFNLRTADHYKDSR